MKKFNYLVFVILFFALISTIIESCKKGDGDPFLSLRSRKSRLTGDWKVSSLKSTYKYSNKTFETTFDGLNKKVVITVKDTIISGSATNFITTQSYYGEIVIDYHKNGSYIYTETFQDVGTGNAITKDYKGDWYFMGGNSQNDYKNKELLAMQVTEFNYNSYIDDDYSTIYQGMNTLDVYEIYQLKNSEIILKVNTTETIDFIKYTTEMEYTLVPR
jgi:hypothetical protein